VFGSPVFVLMFFSGLLVFRSHTKLSEKKSPALQRGFGKSGISSIAMFKPAFGDGSRLLQTGVSTAEAAAS
jgi:hypothetical protein